MTEEFANFADAKKTKKKVGKRHKKDNSMLDVNPKFAIAPVGVVGTPGKRRSVAVVDTNKYLWTPGILESGDERATKHLQHNRSRSTSREPTRSPSVDNCLKLLEQSTCFSSLVRSLECNAMPQPEDEDKEIDPKEELSDQEFQAAKQIFIDAPSKGSSLRKLKGSLSAMPSTLSLPRVQSTALNELAQERSTKTPADGAAAVGNPRLLATKDDLVELMKRIQMAFATVCMECLVDEDLVARVADLDFGDEGNLHEFLCAMVVYKRRHNRNHDKKNKDYYGTLYRALLARGAPLHLIEAEAHGLPMEKMIAFTTRYFPNIPMAEVWQVCEQYGAIGGRLSADAFVQAVEHLVSESDGAVELFSEQRAFEAWQHLGGRSDMSGEVSVDILRDNAPVVNLASHHIDEFVRGTGLKALPYPAFSKMLMELQNKVVDLHLESNELNAAARRASAASHAREAAPTGIKRLRQLSIPLALGRQFSLGVSTDRRNGTSFELDDLSPESQRESTPLSQRLSHILARHDVVQESFRAQTQVSAPTPYMLHSRIFFRKLNKGRRSKPQPLHMRPPPQTQGDVFETFEADFFRKYLLHKVTNACTWQSPYSQAVLNGRPSLRPQQTATAVDIANTVHIQVAASSGHSEAFQGAPPSPPLDLKTRTSNPKSPDPVPVSPANALRVPESLSGKSSSRSVGKSSASSVERVPTAKLRIFGLPETLPTPAVRTT